MKIVVTGALSYSGKYVARRLLARGHHVATLTHHANRPDPFDGQVQIFPLDFDRPGQLEAALDGCQALINTYWVRFDRGANTHARAIENTRRIVDAAARAGVARVVHISITNPNMASPLPYFHGKAQNEQIVMGSSMTYAILRPTILFGTEDVLINNIAFLLRRFPLFLMAGDGSYRLQPVYVDDLAAKVEEAVHRADCYVCDAVGPEIFSFRELVDHIGAVIGRVRPLVSVHPSLLILAARMLGVVLGDVVLTPEEIDGLTGNLLVSSEPPRCATRLTDWLEQNKQTVGLKYASELKRHYA